MNIFIALCGIFGVSLIAGYSTGGPKWMSIGYALLSFWIGIVSAELFSLEKIGRIQRMIFVWIGLPVSLPVLIMVWAKYRLTSKYIRNDDLIAMLKYFYLGQDV